MRTHAKPSVKAAEASLTFTSASGIPVQRYTSTRHTVVHRFSDIAVDAPGPPRRVQPRRNNTGLPDKLKSGIESLSGISLDNVKVHYNSPQPAQFHALAYARGTEIHVAPGQEQHLPHEAWHLVQQAQGRVKPTLQMKNGVQINGDAGLEREADAMGSIAGKNGRSPSSLPSATLQRATNQKGPLQLNGIANKLVGNVFSDAILNLGGSLASTFLPERDAPRYGPLTGRGFGSFMEIRLEPGRFAAGSRTGGADTNPTWEALRLRRTSSGEQLYIQGHLLNYHLGGSGTDWHNLVPLTDRANKRHSKVAEEAVKLAANTPGQKVVYRVRPVYGSWPWQWPAAMIKMVTSPVVAKLTSGAFGELAKLHEAEQHVPSALQCDWWVTVKATGTTSAYSAKIQQDYESSKVYVLYNNQRHDLTNEAWVWNLIEHGLALALRPVLLANVAIESTARLALQGMTAEQMVIVLRRIAGGRVNGLRTVIDSGLTGAVAIVQMLSETYGWGRISALILGLAGQLPGGTRAAPAFVNRELRGTLENLRAPERELIENPDVRQRRAPERPGMVSDW